MAFAGALLAVPTAAGAAQAGGCAKLLGQRLGGGQVLAASTAPERAGSPAFCRVVLESRPAAGSRIGTEVWLPLRDWTGRFVQLGTGGFAGTLPEAGLAAEVRRGNAVAVTDTGHKASDGFDARWAFKAPQRVIDYGYRSLKVSAFAAKAVVRAFYGATPAHSYFVGCSNGGRQALMAAQRYPEDWDGVLAGAPALAWTEQLSSFARIQQALRRAPGAMIPVSKLPVIQAAARACGEDAKGCMFDPGRLACASMVSDACLTAPQIGALKLIARDFDPAAAAIPGGWDQWIINPDRTAQSQLTFAEQFFGQMVLGRAGWRVEDLTARDIERAGALSPVLDAKAGLQRFRRRGGRLVVYLGAADPVISPRRAIDYYRRSASEDFARLYVVPGMLHCQGGPGPNAFGQAPLAPALQPDGEHDIRRALELWVEQGHAPDRLTAVKYVDDDPAKPVAAAGTLEPAVVGRPRDRRQDRKRRDPA
ncbi:MAG: tannase/feruloyl esterase family alpha/beta hydrolase [Phenylobacterium sp.]